MGAKRCGIAMGGASPTFKYDYVAHVSAHTKPSPSLSRLSGARGRPGDEAKCCLWDSLLLLLIIILQIINNNNMEN